MEVKGATFLYTFVVVTITAGGFFGLLLGIRQAVGARPSLLEAYLAKTALIQIFTLSGGALCRRSWDCTTFRNRGFGALPRVFWDSDVGSPLDLSAPTPKSGRNRYVTSRIRSFCRFGKCDNRGDADLRHRWL